MEYSEFINRVDGLKNNIGTAGNRASVLLYQLESNLDYCFDLLDGGNDLYDAKSFIGDALGAILYEAENPKHREKYKKSMYELIYELDNKVLIDKAFCMVLSDLESYLLLITGVLEEAFSNNDNKRSKVLKGISEEFELLNEHYYSLRHEIMLYMTPELFERETIFLDKSDLTYCSILELKPAYKKIQLGRDILPGASVPVKALHTIVQIQLGEFPPFPEGKGKPEAIQKFAEENFQGFSPRNFYNVFLETESDDGRYPTEKHFEELEEYYEGEAFKILQKLRPSKDAINKYP